MVCGSFPANGQGALRSAWGVSPHFFRQHTLGKRRCWPRGPAVTEPYKLQQGATSKRAWAWACWKLGVGNLFGAWDVGTWMFFLMSHPWTSFVPLLRRAPGITSVIHRLTCSQLTVPAVPTGFRTKSRGIRQFGIEVATIRRKDAPYWSLSL